MPRIIWEKGTCELCRENKSLLGHHLSYEKEVIVKICHGCHRIIHGFGRLPKGSQSKLLTWVKDYSSEWVNGSEKYRKSAYRKSKSRQLQKVWAENHKDKIREYNKKWKKENRDAARMAQKKATKKWKDEHPIESRKSHADCMRRYRQRRNHRYLEQGGQAVINF